MQDVTFHSSALGRDMPYRVFLPATIPTNKRLPAVYLLHGGGGSYRDWSNYSDVGRFAERGLVLVMPEGEASYYVNAVDRPADRFEDYITKDLIADVEAIFPVVTGREIRSVICILLGWFWSVCVLLELFVVVH